MYCLPDVFTKQTPFKFSGTKVILRLIQNVCPSSGKFGVEVETFDTNRKIVLSGLWSSFDLLWGKKKRNHVYGGEILLGEMRGKERNSRL